MWVRIPAPTGSPRLLPGRCTVGCPLLQVCALVWVKCREHISLLIILCIIVYVTNKAHPDDKLNFTDHITKTARSFRFALYNIKKIRPFLSEHATQLLVQALVLSKFDYCNALLAGLPAGSIKPLQLIQNAAARLVFNELKRTHVTPLFINLHWLPIAACIKFKALMFAYITTSGSAPLYLNSLLQTYMPSRSLRSASERCITVPSQGGTKSLSLTYSLTVHIWWNDLPNSIRAAESLPIFKKRLKTHLFHLYLTLKL